MKSRAEYLCRSRKIDFRWGNCCNKKTVPVRWKIGLKPLNWVWLQLDLTTDSSPVVLWAVKQRLQETITALVWRGRWEGERGNKVSFLLLITPCTSLYRASLVNINRRLGDNWGRVRIWPQYSNTMTAFATFIYLNRYAQPLTIFYGLWIIAFLSEHPKSDQNLKFLLLRVTTSITVIFIWIRCTNNY